MRTLLAVVFLASLPLARLSADPPTPLTISLGARHGHVTPLRHGFTHTGGGNIDVAQPSPDTILITMTGVAVAGGHPCKDSQATLQFALDQGFEVTSSDPKITKAQLTLEGRAIGLLRSHCKGGGTAEQGPGSAAVTCGTTELLSLNLPSHVASGGQNLSVNCRAEPVSVPALPAKYLLHAHWSITATHPRTLKLCKADSAEFAPDPALDPLWISAWEPFHGAVKKDFGFQLLLKVSPDIEADTHPGKR